MNNKYIVGIILIVIIISIFGYLYWDRKDNNLVGDIVDDIEVSISDDRNIPIAWLDDGIFSDYYELAYNKLKTMTLDEKIGQLLLVRYPDNVDIEEIDRYKLGGFVFFEKDFNDKSEYEVKKMISDLQNISDIPLLIAVDEEGGVVVRVSSNYNLVSSRFKSSQELYDIDGFNSIREDTINKSLILRKLGINLNLAPVVDVSTNSSDYIYYRSFGKDADMTSVYAKTVIEASRGSGVSYTLKHFPGYGNNLDTHNSISIDNRSYDEIINNDLKPFDAGIEAVAEAVLVSHNIVTNIDPDNPASLSKDIHGILRNNLNFTGIIITDDLSMGAINGIDNAVVKALIAGNDIVITADYQADIERIKTSINTGSISETLIDKLAFRVLAWKYYKGLMFENQK